MRRDFNNKRSATQLVKNFALMNRFANGATETDSERRI